MKLIYIEWCDALTNKGWRTREEAEFWADTDDWIVRSGGWLIKETKEYILLALSWNPQNQYEENQFGNLHKIPKTWIKKRKTLMTI